MITCKRRETRRKGLDVMCMFKMDSPQRLVAIIVAIIVMFLQPIELFVSSKHCAVEKTNGCRLMAEIFL